MKNKYNFAALFALALAAALVLNAPVRAQAPPNSLWYNGDFNGINGLANERNTIVSQAAVYDDFIVTSPNGWPVAGVFTSTSNESQPYDYSMGVIGTVVPEPATVALLTCGIGAMLIALRRRCAIGKRCRVGFRQEGQHGNTVSAVLVTNEASHSNSIPHHSHS